MDKMMRLRFVTLLILLLGVGGAHAVEGPRPELWWLYGAWTVEHDEDNTPPDVMAFIPGKYVGYGVDCAYRIEQPFHMNAGDVYVTAEFPKGPIAIVFRPNSDKSRLTFTSPST